MGQLRIEQLSAANIVAVNSLSLKPGQEQFVVPVSYSAAAAVSDPATAWQRVVMDDDTVVAYVQGNFDAHADNPLFRKIIESQVAFAKRAVQWEQDTVVSRKMAFDHYFGPNAKKPI